MSEKSVGSDWFIPEIHFERLYKWWLFKRKKKGWIFIHPGLQLGLYGICRLRTSLWFHKNRLLVAVMKEGCDTHSLLWLYENNLVVIALGVSDPEILCSPFRRIVLVRHGYKFTQFYGELKLIVCFESEVIYFGFPSFCLLAFFFLCLTVKGPFKKPETVPEATIIEVTH